jgi:microcystin-dependent protein
MFAGNFAPRSWAFCDGQLLAVSQNDALFSLLGTIYGGDGRTTFGLPDLRGRIPIHAGHGPGLSERRLGAKGGQEDVTLTVNQLPSHGHAVRASSRGGNTRTPAGAVPAVDGTGASAFYSDQAPDESMNWPKTDNTGGSRSHTNEQPFLCINFIIALFGIYPSRH